MVDRNLGWKLVQRVKVDPQAYKLAGKLHQMVVAIVRERVTVRVALSDYE